MAKPVPPGPDLHQTAGRRSRAEEDAVYADSEKNIVVAIRPKVPFKPVFEIEPEDLAPVHLVLARRRVLVRQAAAEPVTDVQGNRGDQVGTGGVTAP